MTQPQIMQLHPQQAAFCNSKARLRCLAGGVGSGKSVAGSYDLIKRGRPGKNYLVIAPTYTQLADSTMAVFLKVAETLGVLDSNSVKRSAPPELVLKTGARIIFRSGDSPDSLKGVSVSGCWLDEGALLDEQVFLIALARLREDGVPGWLTVTTTPKGRSNWIFSTFCGTNRGDSEIFHTSTRQNIFIDAGYVELMERRYTSRLAAQELLGQFLESTGNLFERSWFPIIDREDVPPLVAKVRSWDLASTELSKKDRDPDFTSGVLLGRDAKNVIYVLDLKHIRGTAQAVQQLVVSTAASDGRDTRILIEQEGGASGKFVVDSFRRLLMGYDFRGIKSTGSKADRAQPLAAYSEAGNVRLVRALWNETMLRELEVFPVEKGSSFHDDICDSMSLGFSKLSTLAIGGAWPILLVPGRQQKDLYRDFSGFDPTPQAMGAQGHGAESPVFVSTAFRPAWERT